MMAGVCRTGKARYAGRGEVRVEISRHKARMDGRFDRNARGYQCPHCGGWHITTKPEGSTVNLQARKRLRYEEDQV